MILLAFALLLLCTVGVAVLIGYLTGSALWGFVALLVVCIAGTIWRNRKTPHERMDALMKDLAPLGFRDD